LLKVKEPANAQNGYTLTCTRTRVRQRGDYFATMIIVI